MHLCGSDGGKLHKDSGDDDDGFNINTILRKRIFIITWSTLLCPSSSRHDLRPAVGIV